MLIDLVSPQGNAFAIIGLANKLGKQMGKTESEIKAIATDMMAGDYDHLLKVFIKHYGLVVKFKNRRSEEED